MTGEPHPTAEQLRLLQEEPAVQPLPGAVTIRVWDLPVRILHWTVVASVVLLSVTGFYIGRPLITVSGDTGFLMGTIRSIHLATAWVFSIAIVCRVIWAFMGNRWERWDQFIPVRRSRRKWIGGTLKYYLFVRKEPPPAAGHNPLAGLTYLVLFLLFVTQIVSGLALAAVANPGGWLFGLTGWVFDWFSIQGVRLFHHLVMWLTLGFVIHHVYSAVLIDVEEKSGLVSSIITGYKRLPIDRT